MRRLLAVLLLLGSTARAATVSIPAGDVALQASYNAPEGEAAAPAVVALHGCGGPSALRDGQWRDVMLAAGHPIVFPDSFGSRGLGSQCTVSNRTVGPNGKRRRDAVAAAAWLAAQPGTPAGGVVVIGWSNGGSTVLAAAARGVMPPGLVRGFVAFYPGCASALNKTDWAPSAPLLVLIGDADDWTPAAPCQALAARFPDSIHLVLVPGAYHDFDTPDRPVRVRHGLAFTANNDGMAHAGTDEPGRALARRLVPEWIAGLQAVR